MNSEAIMKIENIILRRGGVTVLDIPELHVKQGRIIAIIGPNGAGKSTLLLTMAGLLKPNYGKIYYRGNPVDSRASRSEMRRSISVVFQEPLLLNTSVYKNVALGLKFRHLTGSEIEKSVDESLEYFGISSLTKRSAKTLSGGEAKRVSLARAFALKPELIMMDEAFSSLDPPTRESLMEDLRHILEETKITAVMALHDREETLRLAQDVTVMAAGKIIQSGTTSQIFNQPDSEFVANFVGTESILEGTVSSCAEGHMVISVNGKVIEAVGDCSIGQKVYCCLRPENVTISGQAQGNTSARNVFEAKVSRVIRQGFFYKLTLDCGFPLVAYITMPSYDDLEITPGATVIASFKATAVHVIRRER
ncbi:MAG: ABC transporter ATP-binding protein [Deltaproteobacteria bacterium HGW-Deltaproteobacteria-7]|jgi:tungstate transport system ATP-binding protein|nr:MAG: ABC transporter ATP-binding protein [Deltaproteobacteria bacterium HGW-Deltaproteobacteria-7]PKN51890.1 MAG: ABC transporter ATP-binding protein [Deltaproteobacteria bacterium HGW-Deltaproteobacteria-13]